MRIELYQIKDIHNEKWGCSFDFVQKHQGGINPDDYEKVYTCERSEYQATLDGIYEEFNLFHPEDYKAHSLMVSDIIVRYRDGNAEAHYVDDFGFKDVTDLLFKKEVTNG